VFSATEVMDSRKRKNLTNSGIPRKKPTRRQYKRKEMKTWVYEPLRNISHTPGTLMYTKDGVITRGGVFLAWDTLSYNGKPLFPHPHPGPFPVIFNTEMTSSYPETSNCTYLFDNSKPSTVATTESKEIDDASQSTKENGLFSSIPLSSDSSSDTNSPITPEGDILKDIDKGMSESIDDASLLKWLSSTSSGTMDSSSTSSLSLASSSNGSSNNTSIGNDELTNGGSVGESAVCQESKLSEEPDEEVHNFMEEPFTPHASPIEPDPKNEVVEEHEEEPSEVHFPSLPMFVPQHVEEEPLAEWFADPLFSALDLDITDLAYLKKELLAHALLRSFQKKLGTQSLIGELQKGHAKSFQGVPFFQGLPMEFTVQNRS